MSRVLWILFLLPLLPLDWVRAEEPVFSYATPDRKLHFPRDHGSHPDFKIEWWYITGHLWDQNRRRFGFESTFFRLAQKPGNNDSRSAFADSQIYMAHMAVSDLENDAFLFEERLNREGWNAWAKTDRLDLRNGNWSLVRKNDGTMELSGSIESKSKLSLRLLPEKEHVIFGENGVSRKGKSREAASYYITWPRLEAKGTLQLDGEPFEVSGSAWMDHEISSSQLDDDQVGWDWVSIQFDDGRELMAYILRKKDGTFSEFSKLVWIGRDGKLLHRKPDQFRWEQGGDWKSEVTGAIYPIRPRVTTVDPKTGSEVTFQIEPLMEDQEMTGKIGGVPYWEGACDVLDEKGNKVGVAYLELAGYVEGLAERLR